jgi:hypothetical protein
MHRNLSFIKYIQALKGCRDLYGRMYENFNPKDNSFLTLAVYKGKGEYFINLSHGIQVAFKTI